MKPQQFDEKITTDKSEVKQFDQMVDFVTNQKLLYAFLKGARFVNWFVMLILFIPGLVFFCAGSIIGILMGSFYAGVKAFLKGKLSVDIPME